MAYGISHSPSPSLTCTLTPPLGEANVMVEAYDMSEDPNDEALAMYLHEGGEVSPMRETPARSPHHSP